MRILQVSGVLCDEHGGGVGDYVCSLSRYLVERGHDVEVLGYVSGPYKHSAHPFHVHRVRIWPVPHVRFLQWGHGANNRVRRLLESKPFDLVHAHTTSMAFPLFYRSKPPMVLTSHNTSFDPVHGRLRSMFLRAVERSYYGKARRVIAVSQSLRQELVSLGIPPKHVTVIPNGTDASRFQSSSRDRETVRDRLGIHQDEVAFLYVGSLNTRKGFDVLLRAIGHIFRTQQNKTHRFLIVGQGPLMNIALGYSRRCKSVRPLGFICERDLGEIYRASDVFVIPSLYEGMPTALLDAISFGLPVVASDIPVHHEILSRECATFAEIGDPRSLTKALINMAEGKDDFPRMRRKARRISEQYRWERLISEILRVYEDVSKVDLTG